MQSAKRLVFFSVLGVLITSSAGGVTSNNDLWSKFETLRQSPRALHQEFEVSRRVKFAYDDRFSRYKLIIDLAEGKWRQQLVGESGDLTFIFDGKETYVTEPGSTEYARFKRSRDDEALPQPYDAKLDWSKAKELERLPCGFSGKDHACVVIEAPIKPWVRPGIPGNVSKMNEGTMRVMIDTETGMWLRTQTDALVEGSIRGAQVHESYVIKGLSLGAAPDMTFFKLPDGSHEVDELKPWDEARIKKELLGKAAPDLQVSDLQGNRISLASLKGKTVLLDFWATWCPPCQSDGSSLEKLNQKYGNKNLAIVGISISDDRETVEKYLKKHPHSFPVALASENELPRPYQVHALPTYLVVSPDGTLMTATEGDQGFAKLRKDLQKAGLDTD